MSNSLRGGRTRRAKTRRRGRRGGNLAGVVQRAAVPFGLFALSNYLSSGKSGKSRKSTKKGMRRRTARKAYMK